MNKDIFSTTMTGYVVWTNTDLTEGRGSEYPLAICKTLSTAKRLAKDKYVMGTDCSITETTLYRIRDEHHSYDRWFGPVRIIEPSKEDLEKEKVIKEQEEKRERLNTIIKKVRDSMCLTDEEIKVLQEK